MAVRSRRDSVDMRVYQHRCADYSVGLTIASAAFNAGSIVRPRLIGSVCVHYGPGHPLNKTDVFYPDTEGYMPPNSTVEPRSGIIARRALLHGLLSALVATKDIYRIGRASSCLHINTTSRYLDTLWNEWLPDWEMNGWPQQEPRSDAFDVASITSSNNSHAFPNSTVGSARNSLRAPSISSAMNKRRSLTPSVAGSMNSQVSDAGLIFDTETGVLVNEDLLRKVAVFRRNFFVNEKQAAFGGSIIVQMGLHRDTTADRLAKEAVRAAALQMTTDVSSSAERRARRESRLARQSSDLGLRQSVDLAGARAGTKPNRISSSERIRTYSRAPDATGPVSGHQRNRSKTASSIGDSHDVIPEEPVPPLPTSAEPTPPAAKRQSTKSRKEALAASAAVGAVGAGTAAAISRSKSRSQSDAADTDAGAESSTTKETHDEKAAARQAALADRKSRRIRSAPRSPAVEEPPAPVKSPSPPAVSERSPSPVPTPTVEDEPKAQAPDASPIVPARRSRRLPFGLGRKAADKPAAPVSSKAADVEKPATDIHTPESEILVTRAADEGLPKARPARSTQPILLDRKQPDRTEKRDEAAVVAPTIVEPEKPLQREHSRPKAQGRAPTRYSTRSGLSGNETDNEVFDDAQSGYGDLEEPLTTDSALAREISSGQRTEAVADSSTDVNDNKSQEKAEEEPSFLARVTGGAAAVIGLGGGAAAVSQAQKDEEKEVLPDPVAPSRRSFAEEINDAFKGIASDEGHGAAKAEEPAAPVRKPKSGKKSKADKADKASKGEKGTKKKKKKKEKDADPDKPKKKKKAKKTESVAADETRKAESISAAQDEEEPAVQTVEEPDEPAQLEEPEEEEKSEEAETPTVPISRAPERPLASKVPSGRASPMPFNNFESGQSTPLEKKKPVHPFERERKNDGYRRAASPSGLRPTFTPRSTQQAPTPEPILSEIDLDDDGRYPRRSNRASRIKPVAPPSINSPPAASPPTSPPLDSTSARPSQKRRPSFFNFGLARKRHEMPSSPPPMPKESERRSSPPPDRLVDYRSPEQSRIRTHARAKQQEQERARQARDSSESSGGHGRSPEDDLPRRQVAKQAPESTPPEAGKKKKKFSLFQRLSRK